MAFSLIIALWMAAETAVAAAGDACPVDLAAAVPDGLDWNKVYMVRAADGSVWQRAPAPDTSRLLHLREGETTIIQGSAEPHQPVQLYLFQHDGRSSGNMPKPAAGTCFDAGIADEDGNFRFAINARLLWGNIGDTLVVDAFTRLGKEWRQVSAETTDRNYLIATHLPAAIARVGVAAQTADCQKFCPDSPYLIGTRIMPQRFPHIAGNAFPLSGATPPPAADTPAGFTIAKLAPHTYYTIADAAEPAYAEYLDRLAEKALAVEILKRHLIGLTGTGQPVGASLPNALARNLAFLKTIDEDTLARAVAGEGVSPEIETLAQNLRDALVAPAGTATREQALNGLYAAFVAMMPDDTSTYTFPVRADFAAVFPPNRNADSWRADLIDILKLWTGDTEPNRCLIPEADPEMSFITPPQTLLNVPMPDIGCSPAAQSPSSGDDLNMANSNGQGNYRMQHARVSGRDPVLRVNSGIGSLQPDFADAYLTRSSLAFDNSHSWHLQGKAAEISYHYFALATPFSPAIASKCLVTGQLPGYAAGIAEAAALPAEAATLIKTELLSVMPEPNTTYLVEIADPQAIGQMIKWQADGRPFEPAQLFFRVKRQACGNDDDLPLPVTTQKELQNKAPQAYEVGLVE